MGEAGRGSDGGQWYICGGQFPRGPPQRPLSLLRGLRLGLFPQLSPRGQTWRALSRHGEAPFLPPITWPCPCMVPARGRLCVSSPITHKGRRAWAGRPSPSVLFGCVSSGGPRSLGLSSPSVTGAVSLGSPGLLTATHCVTLLCVCVCVWGGSLTFSVSRFCPHPLTWGALGPRGKALPCALPAPLVHRHHLRPAVLPLHLQPLPGLPGQHA